MNQRTCIEVDCFLPHAARGYCARHYAQHRRDGDLKALPVKTALERMSERIEYIADCWVWTGSVWPNGYGQLMHEGKHWLAHRLSYTLHVGPIPEGLVLDHLCRVPPCINPDHLEPVTLRINLARGMSPTAQVIRSGICHRGHALTASNLYTPPGDPRQARCRECMRIVRAERYAIEKQLLGKPDATRGRLCEQPGCGRKHYGKGMCRRHYQRALSGRVG